MAQRPPKQHDTPARPTRRETAKPKRDRRPLRGSRRAPPAPTMRMPYLRLLVTAALLGTTVCAVLVGWVPDWLVSLSLLLSVLTFGLYWHDKRAAITNKGRVPERSLQLLALAGGWLGALLAQQWLRHKNRKTSFQYVFWLCVVTNLLVLYALLRAH